MLVCIGNGKQIELIWIWRGFSLVISLSLSYSREIPLDNLNPLPQVFVHVNNTLKVVSMTQNTYHRSFAQNGHFSFEADIRNLCSKELMLLYE